VGPFCNAPEQPALMATRWKFSFSSFPSPDALDAYLKDERRIALAGIRDRVVARTRTMRVDLV
jgi:hypothetical protein